MRKKILIGGDQPYTINYDQETANRVLDALIKWMEHKDHYSAWGGEGICQSDNCQIDAPQLIGDIVDDILEPESEEEDIM